jgi:beta-glucosidase
VERPRRSLVTFRRVELAAGDSRQVELTVPLRRLAWFDPAQDGFVLEGGRHRLVLARHSEDQGQACELLLRGGWLER